MVDLETEQVVRRFEIPEDIVVRGNGLASITVDVDPSNCHNAYGYIPDLATYHLYVFRYPKYKSVPHNNFVQVQVGINLHEYLFIIACSKIVFGVSAITTLTSIHFKVCENTKNKNKNNTEMSVGFHFRGLQCGRTDLSVERRYFLNNAG